MELTDRELADMLGHAALQIRSYEPRMQRRHANCWCIEPWKSGHDDGCAAMRAATKAWKQHKET
ncbi:MAG: hypothetical protein HY323_07060 [Betaproteobacteria bacterium]|nr:hypothetical protein [Betaproteobacteria bacterium]